MTAREAYAVLAGSSPDSIDSYRHETDPERREAFAVLRGVVNQYAELTEVASAAAAYLDDYGEGPRVERKRRLAEAVRDADWGDFTDG